MSKYLQITLGALFGAYDNHKFCSNLYKELWWRYFSCFQDDEDEAEEEEGGLSKSGKELKKLLGKANGLNEPDGDDDDDDGDVSA